MSTHASGRAPGAGGGTEPIGPQTLRLLERRGVVTPERCHDGTFRLSAADAARISRIVQLVSEGVALAAVLEMRGFRVRAQQARRRRSHLERCIRHPLL